MIHRSSRAVPSWVASLEPSAPLAAIDVQHACRSPIAWQAIAKQPAERGPASVPQQGRNPAVAIPAELACQLDHVGDQAFLVSTPMWQPTLRGSVLTQDAAHTTFGNLHLAAHMIDAGTAARGAQKFPFAASDRISLSSVRSETARRRRSFSFWSRFSSLSCSVPIPPYFFFQR